jgi:hypothetical protein
VCMCVCVWRIAVHCCCVCSYMHKQLRSRNGAARMLAHVLHGQRKKCNQPSYHSGSNCCWRLSAQARKQRAPQLLHTNPRGKTLLPPKITATAPLCNNPQHQQVDKHGTGTSPNPRQGAAFTAALLLLEQQHQLTARTLEPYLTTRC